MAENTKFNAIIRDNSLLEVKMLNLFNKEFPVGSNVQVTLKGTKKEVRSIQQNRFLWGYIYRPVVEHLLEMGEVDANKDDLHVFCLTQLQGFKFANKTLLGMNWTVLEKASTKTMSKEVFSQYVEKIIKYFAEEKGMQWDFLIEADTSVIETKHFQTEKKEYIHSLLR